METSGEASHSPHPSRPPNGVDETETQWFRDNYVTGHHMPAKRACMPEEIASVCYFLAGDGASYMTGETVHVDGGLTITF